MYKLMQRGRSNLYYSDTDGLIDIVEDPSLELGDRVYCLSTDKMYYVGSDKQLFDEEGYLYIGVAIK